MSNNSTQGQRGSGFSANSTASSSLIVGGVGVCSSLRILDFCLFRLWLILEEVFPVMPAYLRVSSQMGIV
ncbi:MAG: hypothetical protein AAFO04_12740 [Cyanobacteria bacterium J06592_8]